MLTGPARIVSLAHKLPATVRTQQELSDAFLDKLVTHDAKAFEKLHPRRPSAHQFDNQLFTHDDHVDRPLDAVANDHGSPPRQSFDKIKSIFNNAGVSKRGMLMPLKFSHSPVERDTESIYVETGDKLISLAAEVCQTALEASTVSPSSVAAGVLVMELSGCPPRDTQLFFGKNLGLRNDLVQDPIIGLGCAGGSKGLSHTADRLKAYPQQACLLTAAECTSRVWSTEFERRLASKVADGALALATGDEQGLKTAQYEMMNSAVIAALMGDGAAACVVVGAEVRRIDN
jgi:predicted naringenin-chalcone synthase